MPKELTITDERVQEVAKTCPTADRVLRGLFPEAFTTNTPCILGNPTLKVMAEGEKAITIEKRYGGKYADVGLYLGEGEGEWRLVKDSEHCQVLLPPWVPVK